METLFQLLFLIIFLKNIHLFELKHNLQNCPMGFSCQDPSKIEPCPKGSFSHGIGICVPCALGFYANNVGSDRCKNILFF